MRTIQVAAQIVGISPKADRSVTFRVVTEREILPEEFSLFMSYFQHSGWMLFRENEFREDDVPASDAPTGKKTPAQRLRSVIYALWKEQHPGATASEFPPFYEQTMESIIQAVKDKLD